MTESRDVDSHVSGTPQAGSREIVIPLQTHTAADDYKVCVEQYIACNFWFS